MLTDLGRCWPSLNLKSYRNSSVENNNFSSLDAKKRPGHENFPCPKCRKWLLVVANWCLFASSGVFWRILQKRKGSNFDGLLTYSGSYVVAYEAMQTCVPRGRYFPIFEPDSAVTFYTTVNPTMCILVSRPDSAMMVA